MIEGGPSERSESSPESLGHPSISPNTYFSTPGFNDFGYKWRVRFRLVGVHGLYFRSQLASTFCVRGGRWGLDNTGGGTQGPDRLPDAVLHT